MKMKRISAFFLAMLMLLSMAACTADDNTETDPTPDTDAAESIRPSAGLKPTEPKEEGEPAEPAKTAPTPMDIMVAGSYYGLYDTEDTDQLLCSAQWENMLLSAESAEVYPALQAQLLKDLEDNDRRQYTFIVDSEEYAKEMNAESDYFGGLTSHSDYTVQRADDRILSVRVDEDAYTGGVHPNYWVLGFNYDPATGEQLDLTDVLTDLDDLPSILTKKITQKYDFEPFEGLEVTLGEYLPTQYTWTMDYQGITFYFSPYEIASYAAGLLTATIWYDEMPELFAEGYTEVPDGGWSMPLPMTQEIAVDLAPGDALRDTLYLSAYEEEYGTLELYITKNGKEQKLDSFYGYTAKPMLVCLGEPGQERFFLYLEGTAENDYNTLYIYDLNGEAVVLNQTLEDCGFSGIWLEDIGEYGTWFETVINAPASMILSSTVYRLGTWTATRRYTSDPADGSLQPETTYFSLPAHDHALTSLVDLEVTILPEEKTETIPAGTAFYYRMTDNETYADLELEDGRMCRIELEYEDYTSQVNGMPEWECFDGIVYAG